MNEDDKAEAPSPIGEELRAVRTDVVVQVRVLETTNRTGPYYRGDRLWTPGWQDAVVSPELLQLLEADVWLEVRVLDPRLQAAKKAEIAKLKDDEAKAAQLVADDLRRRADELLEDAKRSLEAVGHEAPPAAAAMPTPYKDALRAAMPDKVRAVVDDQKAGMAETRAQIASPKTLAPPPSPVPDLDRHGASPKSGGALEQAKSQAAGHGSSHPPPTTKSTHPPDNKSRK